MEHFRGTAGSMIKTVNALFASFLSEKREKQFLIKKKGYSSSHGAFSSSLTAPLPPIRISCHLALVISS